MDIKLSLDLNLQAITAKAANNLPDLKLNQLLEAKVVDTQIMLNTLALSVADKTVLVQASQPLTLPAGQTLQLQVVKLLPAPEFKIILPALPQATDQVTARPVEAPILKLLNPQSPPLSANPPVNIALNQLAPGQQLQAGIVNIAGDKITLRLLPAQTAPAQTPPSANPANPLVTLDSKQLILTDAASPNSPKTTAPALTAGTLINLQVLKGGSSPTFSFSIPLPDPQQKIVETFKQLLPIQASPTPLLNRLDQILPTLDNNATVAETLKRLAREILNSIPLETQLSEPVRLKQTVDQSGLFLESKLAELLSGKDGAALPEDFKFKLVKLIQLLTVEIEAQARQKSEADSSQLFKEILQKAQNALAKLTVDQLNSLPRDESSKQGWVLELPFFHNHKADSVQIEIEQEKRGGNDERQKNWAVSITITPPDLATIHCRISCYDGAVNTRFWSEAADTVEKINAHLDYLKQQFERKGLTTGFMEAHQGKPAQTEAQKTAFPNLLSEKV